MGRDAPGRNGPDFDEMRPAVGESAGLATDIRPTGERHGLVPIAAGERLGLVFIIQAEPGLIDWAG
jgi:hypothetical protein